MNHEELKQLQQLPLETKILWAIEKIKEWYEHYDGRIYVAFSGGKDSDVLLDIVRSIYPDVPAVFVDTGLEYPEIRDFVKTIDNVTWLKPKMPFNKVIEKYGYPVVSKEQSQFIGEARNTKSEKLRDIRLNGNKSGRGKVANKWKFLLNAPFKISHKCCDIMKKEPSKRYEKETGRHPIIGTMTGESKLREQKYLSNGCNAFDQKRPTSAPLSIWTDQDILNYILDKNLPYCCIYGEIVATLSGELETTGEDRTGCMFCMYGCHKDNPNRLQKMATTHQKQYDYCMNVLGLRKVLDFMGIKHHKVKPTKDKQSSLF